MTKLKINIIAINQNTMPEVNPKLLIINNKAIIKIRLPINFEFLACF